MMVDGQVMRINFRFNAPPTTRQSHHIVHVCSGKGGELG